jgi:cation transport ATPase
VASADGHVVEGEYTFNYGEANVTGAPYTVKKKSNTAIYGASTVLIVLTGLFGIWAYRRRRE